MDREPLISWARAVAGSRWSKPAPNASLPSVREAIGLRYNVATRIDGYNISQGKAISIAIFRSEGTQ